jgi:hypothetical protein
MKRIEYWNLNLGCTFEIGSKNYGIIAGQQGLMIYSDDNYKTWKRMFIVGGGYANTNSMTICDFGNTFTLFLSYNETNYASITINKSSPELGSPSLEIY